MSQFESDDFRRQRSVVVQAESTKKGGGAGWAFLISLLFFIPLAPLLGLFMGLAGRRSSPLLGTCAAFLGLVFTLGQAFAGYRGYDYYTKVTDGPGQALTAGFDGDVAGFRGSFAETSFTSEEEATAFIDELRSRYGKLLFVRLLQPVEDFAGREPLTTPHMYELIFENGTVQAEAAIAFEQNVTPAWLESSLMYLSVQDPKHGDLSFPAPETQQLVSQPTD